MLPPTLQAGIDELTGTIGAKELEHSAQALSDAYRAGGTGASRAARTAGEVAAYLAVRAPATYAAATEVFRQARSARPSFAPASLLDLGAGPGVASWAATEAWPEIASVRFVEAEPEMVRAGRLLAARGTSALKEAAWEVADARVTGPQADLVIVSYVLGELEAGANESLIRHAWARTADTLVIVEPGTTAGYERVLAARTVVTAAGGSTLAPCPHDADCPLPAGDWCHFAARLPRSRVHRAAKGAERGFEDEKFAYVVLCRAPHVRPSGRVLRRPDLRPGHVVLALCTQSGLEARTVSRREGAGYRRARKTGWGDSV